MSVNIGRDNSDASYRYKMPKMQTKIEGRGNGIKTVIVNMSDIAKALHVEPSYPTKFFGFELGAQSSYKDDKAVVNGAHNVGDLAKLLEKFIAIFVLCPTCTLPEIRTSIKKGALKIECAACGHNGVLKTAHKLATYIIKNPPEKGATKETAGVRKVDEVAIAADAANAARADGGGDADTADGADADAAGDEAKAKKDAKSADSKKKEAVVWFTDTSEGAIKARQDEELRSMQRNSGASAAAALAAGADTKSKKEEAPAAASSSSSSSSAASAAAAAASSAAPAATAPGGAEVVLRAFLATKGSDGKARTPEEVLSELKRIQLARGLDDAKRLHVLFEAAVDLTKPATVLKEFKERLPLLKKAAHTGAERKLMCQVLEQVIGVSYAKLAGYAPHLLQLLYEGDVLTEEAITAWANTPVEAAWLVPRDTATLIRKKAKPFLDWLKNAEEED